MIQTTLVLKIRDELKNDVMENNLRENQITEYIKMNLFSVQTRSTGQIENNFVPTES